VTEVETNQVISTKISIVTACFNSVDTIRNTIDSVNIQSYPNIEHVFVDGLSTDNTLSLIRNLSVRNKIVKSESDNGIYDALNKGIRLSTGDVIGFLHADDFYPSNDVVAKIAQAFKDPAVQAVYGDLQYVPKDDPNKVFRHWKTGEFSSSKLLRGWMPPHPTLYIRRELYDKIGGFDTKYRIAADYDSILKLFSDPDLVSVYIPEVLVKMRTGGASNRSIRNIIKKSREDLNALKSSNVGGLYTLVAKNLRKIGQLL
jgi:glycosyltransferase